jgi:hypothetical protein
VVAAVHVPGEPALELDPGLAQDDHRDALVQAETGDRALVGVLVVPLREAPHARHHVVAEDLRLAQRVLGVRRAPGALAGGEVGDLGVVAGGPDVVRALDLEGRRGVHVASRTQRQAEAGERRVGLHTGRPHDGGSVDLESVGEHHVLVDARRHRRAEVDLDAPLLQVLQAPLAELRADLGEDLVRGVDEDEAHVLALDVRVVRGGVAGHVLDLADGLRAGEPAADEDEGERPAADLLVGRGVGLVQLLEDVVAQADGLLDALHADAVLGEAGDREGAGDRAERDHQVVEGQLVGLAHERLDRGDLAVLVDGGDPPGEHLGPGEHASQRDDDMPRGDAAGCGFGEEGLVRHVRARVDDRDGRLAVPHLLHDAARRVQADVTAAYNEDPWTLRGAHASSMEHGQGGPS